MEISETTDFADYTNITNRAYL